MSLIKMSGMTPAEVARQAGISRQSLTAWQKRAEKQRNPNINVYSQTHEKIAQVLKMNINDLNRPLKAIDTDEKLRVLEAELLWDRLYPNIESFVVALVKGDFNALARLVQTYGLYASAKIAGKQVWDKFPTYKNKIHPAYRKSLEVVWNLKQNPI